MPIKKKDESGSIEVTIDINTTDIEFYILGISPLVMNRMSQKAIRGLLFPEPKKNRAEQAQTLKHDPVQEFRDSVYMNRDTTSPALFHMPGGAFKGAIANVAKDIPGAFKTQVGRLVQVKDINIDLFGLPQLHMAIVRNSDINRTPDVRTRACFPRWACRVTTTIVTPLMRDDVIAKLTGAAGIIVGVGDGRPERGKLAHGKFAIVDPDHPEWNDIVKKEARVAQQRAIDKPVCYDQEAEDLLAWFEAERIRRAPKPGGTKTTATKRNGKDHGVIAAREVTKRKTRAPQIGRRS